METEKTDIVIVGTGASGLFAALHLPRDKRVLMITKDEVENSDSFLAQGGICVLHDKDDYDSFMEDTLKAGSHGHLLIELGALCQIGIAIKVIHLEHLRAALAGGSV